MAASPRFQRQRRRPGSAEQVRSDGKYYTPVDSVPVIIRAVLRHDDGSSRSPWSHRSPSLSVADQLPTRRRRPKDEFTTRDLQYSSDLAAVHAEEQLSTILHAHENIKGLASSLIEDRSSKLKAIMSDIDHEGDRSLGRVDIGVGQCPDHGHFCSLHPGCRYATDEMRFNEELEDDIDPRLQAVAKRIDNLLGTIDAHPGHHPPGGTPVTTPPSRSWGS